MYHGIYCNVSNLHCPPATHLMPIHQSVNMVQWWQTCRKVTWLNFFLRMKNTVSKYSMPFEMKYHHKAPAICFQDRHGDQKGEYNNEKCKYSIHVLGFSTAQFVFKSGDSAPHSHLRPKHSRFSIKQAGVRHGAKEEGETEHPPAPTF